MALKNCIYEMQRAAGRTLTPDEINELLEELELRIERLRRTTSATTEEASLRAASEFAADMKEAATIAYRNAAINLKVRFQAIDYTLSNFADDPALGIEAIQVGVNRGVKGARDSAASEQNQLQRYYGQGFISEMSKAGLWREFVSGAFDRDIADALWALNRSEPIPVNVPREAAAMAKIIAKWQEVARLDANKAGAWIKKLDGYIVRQSHHQFTIARAGYQAWRDEILPRLDLDRTIDDGSDVEAFLRAVWEGLASGVHLKTPTPSGFTGPRNLAKKMSAERVLHFKSAGDWFAYNQRFGTGNLREAVLRGLELAAQNTGLMRRLGTNPEATLTRIVEDLQKRVDPEQRRRLSKALDGKLKHQLAELDGSTRIPLNEMGAQVASTVRSVNRMAKLGGALLSQFGDVAFYGSEMRYQGRSMLSGVAESIGNIFKGRGDEDRQQLAGMLSVFSDFAIGDVTARFSIAEDGLPGAMSTAQQVFFKWNGMTWWTDRQRRGAVFAMAHHLALNKAKTFDALDTDLQRVLGLYNIGATDWDTIRSAATQEADGRSYVVPDNIGNRETADKLRAYYIDRMSFAALEPDQRTRATMQRGSRPGTVLGEMIRFFGEFKAFPAAAIQKAWGREIYGRGATKLTEALRNGNGEMLGLAQLMLWSTIFGYISLSAKDLAKGRTPRDPLDRKTWGAAFVQGGGASIYGDFLFGEMKNRFGQTFVSTLGGPTAGTVDDLADLIGRAKSGDDFAAQSLRVTMNNTPFLNMFYSRIALDYLFLYQIQEALNPGSLKRMERRVQKENGQTFLIRPSAVAR